MCNGEFFSKEPNEALPFFYYLAESVQQWNTQTNRVSLTAQPLRAIAGGGRYELKEDTNVQARIAALTRRLEVMEMEKVKAVKTVEVCSLCTDSNHKTQDCLVMPVFQQSDSEQMQLVNWVNRAQNQPFSNTYNPGWRNHPNFSCRNDKPDRSPPPSQQPFHQAAPQHQYQPYQSSQNYHFVAPPGFQPHVTAQSSQSQSSGRSSLDDREVFETVKDVLTLRSGKEVPQPEMTMDTQVVAPTPKDATETDEAEKEPEVVRPELKKPVSADVETSRGYQPVVSYPQRLASVQKNKCHTEIQEIFKQVKINIPLLDVIQQVPSYAKFLKDLCAVKRKLNVKKKAFLTEQVSALILSETPQKFRDPGSPSISIIIGESRIGRALLDLGSSVKMLPFSVYEQLGLGELKKTSIMLQLADKSVKELKGIVEDVLVQVDKFYYPVDFVVLDISGVLKLTFGNMALELNVFNACKMPTHFDDTTDIKGIDAVVCTRRIHLEDDARPVHDAQRRLNPTMKEVVKVEVLKLFAVGIIYPISDSKWHLRIRKKSLSPVLLAPLLLPECLLVCVMLQLIFRDA
ncbi:uncharacterized protein LOC108985990 [Juglans regia]|uniref:Uncharacterized protein LOC108985990 n=1 Tax=Juglans regia TaxID=51240 RepID=A0A6P9ERT7_JUGRE|nr:uncharacterized protein LOC108985990 [Juglans regia]